jgi:hypothetical protein
MKLIDAEALVVWIACNSLRPMLDALDAINSMPDAGEALQKRVEELEKLIDVDVDGYEFVSQGKLQAQLAAEREAKNRAITQCADLLEKVHELERENATLRGTLAESGLNCAYCGLPKADWEKCASGFPGCARMATRRTRRGMRRGWMNL